jgi:hypothetical protein
MNGIVIEFMHQILPPELEHTKESTRSVVKG